VAVAILADSLTRSTVAYSAGMPIPNRGLTLVDGQLTCGVNGCGISTSTIAKSYTAGSTVEVENNTTAVFCTQVTLARKVQRPTERCAPNSIFIDTGLSVLKAVFSRRQHLNTKWSRIKRSWANPGNDYKRRKSDRVWRRRCNRDRIILSLCG